MRAHSTATRGAHPRLPTISLILVALALVVIENEGNVEARRGAFLSTSGSFQLSSSSSNRGGNTERGELGSSLNVIELDALVKASKTKEGLALLNELSYLKHRAGEVLEREYDSVITATGWKHDLHMYATDTTPKMQSQEKYPRMTVEYESSNVPGKDCMYFALVLN